MALEQHDPKARALEKECDRMYALYEEKAKVVSDLWKKASKVMFQPDTGKAVRMINEDSPFYPEYAVADLEKQEALVEWQRAQHAHGNVLIDRK